MRIEKIHVRENIIWIVIDPLQIDNQILNNQFFCYFKLTQPTDIIYGELFRGDNGKPIIFNSPEQAIEYANANLNSII